MKALIINCSPVRTGATAEIAKLVSEQLSAKGHLGLTSIEYKTDVEPRKHEIVVFCKSM